VRQLEDRTVPTTFNIANGDVQGLINAINTANSDGQADVINLAQGGTYAFAQANNNTNGPNALPVILSQNLSIFGNGSVLDAPTSPAFARFFSVAAGATLSLDSVSLSYGQAQGQPSSPPNGQYDQGGAIYNAGGNVNLHGVNIAHCAAQWTNGHGGYTADLPQRRPRSGPGRRHLLQRRQPQPHAMRHQ
jgi:hypothetical protein